MTQADALLVALGIALGLYLFHKTGYSPGGIITPGFLAMILSSPHRTGAVLLCSALVAGILSLVVRGTGIYGRQRTGAAMLIALGVKIALDGLFPGTPFWIGWVVPGLLGADMERQGFLPTTAASLAAAFAASMAASLVRALPLGLS